MNPDLMKEQLEKQKRKSQMCEKYFQTIRERILFSSELTKYEIKHREIIIIQKSYFQQWRNDEIGTLTGRVVGDFAEIKKDLENEGTQGDAETKEIIDEFVRTLKCKTITNNKSKSDMKSIIDAFDEEGEFEITEGFPDSQRHMYFEIKDLLQKDIYNTILQYHENLQAEFLIQLEKQIISNDSDIEQVYQIYLKPILKYKVHKRNSLEMETLISYIFSIIPQENFVIESDQIIDPREHIPFLTQTFEENNINEIQLLRTKDIKLYWDDIKGQFDVSKSPLPIQKGEIAHNVKASFEEYFFDLTNAQNKNITCFANILQSGLKVELQQGESFDPERIQLQINPIIKETAQSLQLSKISEQSIRILKKNTLNSILAILFINHKKKLSQKALKDIYELKKQYQEISVCVLDVEESDTQFINSIKQNQYEKEMEFYYCDYSVQIQLESIFPMEYYPAIMLVDNNNTIIAKEQYYQTNWQENIKGETTEQKQIKGLSLTAKLNEQNQTAYEQIYKQIKEKFLKDSKKKLTLFNCGQQLKSLGYPTSLELCISNQHILDWEGTFKQKIYNQPYLQHNISPEHTHYIQPLLDLIFSQAQQDKFYKRICNYQIQRGTHCAICNHQFNLGLAKSSENNIINDQENNNNKNNYNNSNNYVQENNSNSNNQENSNNNNGQENQYFSYLKNEYYCETCFYDSNKRYLFYKNIIFIHFQAVLQSFHVDQFGLNIQEELSEKQFQNNNSNGNSNKSQEQYIQQFENLQEEVHQNIECIGCLQQVQGRRWICLSCDKSRENENIKNQINLCDSCQSLMKKKKAEERIPEKMFKSSEILINIESMNHQSNHITLGVSFFYGKNIY